jgi:hypothetical protein
MTPREREALIEAVTTAFRPRDLRTGALRAHDAWHDLDDAGRVEAYHATLLLRDIEAALDPDELSTTGRAVLARIRRGG